MKIWLDRTVGGCKASDEESAAVLNRIPPGTSFEVDVVTKRTRSVSWNRRYWALMKILASNCEQVEIEPDVWMPITDSESAHVAMKYLTGLYDSYAIKGGVVRLIKSTAFEKMDAEEWADYWQKVLDAVCQKFIPGVSIPDVELEIMEIAGLAGGSR